MITLQPKQQYYIHCAKMLLKKDNDWVQRYDSPCGRLTIIRSHCAGDKSHGKVRFKVFWRSINEVCIKAPHHPVVYMLASQCQAYQPGNWEKLVSRNYVKMLWD